MCTHTNTCLYVCVAYICGTYLSAVLEIPARYIGSCQMRINKTIAAPERQIDKSNVGGVNIDEDCQNVSGMFAREEKNEEW